MTKMNYATKLLDEPGSIKTSCKRSRSNISRRITVRPPKWYKPNATVPPNLKFDVEEFERLQAEYLGLFRQSCDAREWHGIHNRHFDWWQFPIDDGSREEFNVRSEADVEILKSNTNWLSSYRESVKLVAKAWGWNIDTRAVMKDGGFWDNKDVRLAKMIRSLWLFEQADYFVSLQQFAHHVNNTHNNNSGLFYGRICLDEVLFMELPRRYFQFPLSSDQSIFLGLKCLVHHRCWRQPLWQVLLEVTLFPNWFLSSERVDYWVPIDPAQILAFNINGERL